MSIDEITSLLDGKILLGNQKHAQDLNQLESLQVTHVIACGFQKGFHEGYAACIYYCSFIMIDYSFSFA